MNYFVVVLNLFPKRLFLVFYFLYLIILSFTCAGTLISNRNVIHGLIMDNSYDLIFNDTLVSDSNSYNFSNNILNINNVSILSINVNSFNMSTNNANHINTNRFLPKLNHVLSNKCSIYLLQDIRLSDATNSKKKFLRETQCNLYGNFDVFINSSKGSGGTAILINHNLNYKVFNVYKSVCENVIGLDLAICGVRLSLFSVYGPRKQIRCRNFFDVLKTKIENIGNCHYIFGGDLNCLTNVNIHDPISPLLNNIDLQATASIPNVNNSQKLADWIENDFSCDLFRINNPNLIEHSHIPFGVDRPNRSRIDHFISSPSLADVFTFCEYIPLLRTLFDHKAIVIKSKSLNKGMQKGIDGSLLNIIDLEDFIKLDLYVLFMDHFTFENRLELLLTITDINLQLNYRLKLLNCKYANDLLVKNFIEKSNDRIKSLFNKFPNYEDIFDLACNINPNQFLEVFLNSARNACVSRQSGFIKESKFMKNKLLKELHALKKRDNWTDENFSKIKIIENHLSVIEDEENLRRFENFKHFQCLSLEKPSKQFAKLLKNDKKSQSLNILKDANGNDFTCDSDRSEFLKDTFNNKFSDNHLPTLTIQEFFGEDINHPLVQNRFFLTLIGIDWKILFLIKN